MAHSIYTPLAPKPLGPYVQALKAGHWLFLSGQLPLVPESNKLKSPDIQEQTRQVLENIKAVLQAAGSHLSHLVQVTVYLLDLKDAAAMNAVYQEYLSPAYPARALVQVAKLPAQARIEMAAIAYGDAEEEENREG